MTHTVQNIDMQTQAYTALSWSDGLKIASTLWTLFPISRDKYHSKTFNEKWMKGKFLPFLPGSVCYSVPCWEITLLGLGCKETGCRIYVRCCRFMKNTAPLLIITIWVQPPRQEEARSHPVLEDRRQWFLNVAVIAWKRISDWEKQV